MSGLGSIIGRKKQDKNKRPMTKQERKDRRRRRRDRRKLRKVF